MKKIIFSLISFMSSSFIFAQKPIASSCSTDNCYKLSIKVEKRGDQDRLYFVITNKMPGSKDLALFLEDKDGKWYSQGFSPNPVPSKGAYTFDRFHATGDYVIYYKDAGDNTQRFPTQDEVQEKFGKKKYGYGKE